MKKQHLGLVLTAFLTLGLAGCSNSSQQEALEQVAIACYGEDGMSLDPNIDPEQYAAAEKAASLDSEFSGLYQVLFNYESASILYETAPDPKPEDVKAKAIAALMIKGDYCENALGLSSQ